MKIPFEYRAGVIGFCLIASAVMIGYANHTDKTSVQWFSLGLATALVGMVIRISLPESKDE